MTEASADLINPCTMSFYNYQERVLRNVKYLYFKYLKISYF